MLSVTEHARQGGERKPAVGAQVLRHRAPAIAAGLKHHRSHTVYIEIRRLPFVTQGEHRDAPSRVPERFRLPARPWIARVVTVQKVERFAGPVHAATCTVVRGLSAKARRT